jgi:diguanylate cyclase (GGDEF)-like protein/PAS domain S-box-containing protein
MRILLVEDNVDHRELMSLALTGHDPTWLVEEVASGEEALRRLAEEGAYDLVFLDYSLPRRNGLEVLERIRRGEAPPPVVMVTGRGNEQVAVRAMKAGAYDYVVKGKGYLQRLPVVARRAVEAHQLAVDRKRAEEEIRQRTAQLEALRKVGLDLTTQLDLDVLLHSIVSRAVELLGGTSGGLYLYRPKQDVLEWAMAVGPHLAPIGAVLRRGEGLSGKVWETGEPLIVDDYEQWDKRAVVYEGYSRAVVGVPVRWGEEFLGVLNVLADPPRTFSPADAKLLSLFATQAAIAIRNARLYEGEQERRHIAETLRQASTILSSTLELDEVLRLILQQLRQVIPYDSASVQRLQGERLEIVACEGFEEPDKVMGLAFPLDPKFPNCRVVTTRAPLAIEDVIGDYPHFKDEANTYDSGRIRSWLGVPLMVKDQVIGMIALDRAEVHPYTAEETQLAMAFANQASIAIENARLFEEIEERRMYLEGVLGAAPDAIVTLDARHRVVEWNPGAERLFGYSREEAIGRNLDHLVTNPDTFEEAVGLTQIIMSGREVPPLETVRYRKDGSHVHVIVAGSPILVGDELIGIVAVYTDITQRKRMEDALRAMLVVDELTGLYNRRGFLTLGQQQLKMADRAKRKMVLLFADFDELKRINDALGHSEGDRALIEIASVLRETFRESDIIARIGGDEFVVLAIETDGVSAETLTTRLKENLEARNARGDRHYKLSLSVGIARYDPKHSCSIDELLARADRLMYEQKQDNHKS